VAQENDVSSSFGILHGHRVLVTGAGGFIGSHLVERLVTEGARVRAFVRYTSRADAGLLKLAPADIRGRIEMVFGDLRDEAAVHEAVRDVEIVFHLGALIAIPYSYVHPREVVETNVIGTLNVLMAARAHGVRRIVNTSTSEVYGTALTIPITENHPLQGQSPYSASKIAADKLTESFARSFDIRAVTVRPFNTFGPRQSARAVIPTVISQALTSTEIRLGDLSPTRDFTYVTDTVDGFVRAACTDNIDGETFNLGNDREISVGDLAHLIVRLVDRPVKVVTDNERIRPQNSEVRRLHADATKARQLLGWTPQVSLEQGLRQTIGWISEHADYFEPQRYTV
jgi:NAD dependent epimerase/dehydratase